MNVTFLGLCRGDGKIFIKAQISGLSEASHITCSSHQESGSKLPCSLYKASEGNISAEYVIALPILDITQVVLIEEIDAMGISVSQFTKKISAFSAKWESRLNYRLKAEEMQALKNYDERYLYDQISMRFWTAVEQGSFTIVHGTLSLPQDSRLENIRITCLDAKGTTVDLNPLFLGEERYHPVAHAGSYVTNVEVSLLLPLTLQNYCFTFEDAAQPKNEGFSVMEKDWYNTILNTARATMSSAQGDARYHDWFLQNRSTGSDLVLQKTAVFEQAPLFSIVVPLYKTPLNFLDAMIGSVISQSYAGWELLLVNASPEDAPLKTRAQAFCDSDARIKHIELAENKGISENTNAGIEHAQGDFICFFDHDDVLEPNALYEYACAIEQNSTTGLLYCDEDKLGEDGRYFDPFFKPDFNLDLLRNNNYICHLLCVRRSLLDQVGMLDPLCDGAQDHDLTLRVIERAEHVHHVAKVLYHWRVSAQSTAGNAESKSYATDAGIRAVQKHLDRCNTPASVSQSRRPFTYKIDYHLPAEKPLVSIVIPNKDNKDILCACIDSIRNLSTYGNYEIVIVENNSTSEEIFTYYRELESDTRIRTITYDGSFNFSAIVNVGVEASKGDYAILLNNDTEVITPSWIERMLGICAREEVGAVGVKLYYPDDTIQHAGIAITPIVASSLHVNLPRNNWGYFALNDAEQNLSAVTAACVMVKRSAYDEVDGFTEELSVAFNDVDFCLKLREKDYLVVYTPEVELYHYESLSRGYENTPSKKIRFEKEIAYMRGRWAEYYVTGDPYFNTNFYIGYNGPVAHLPYFKLPL